MKFQAILLVAAALMITYVQAAPIDIVEQPDVDPNDQKAKCGYDMMICLPVLLSIPSQVFGSHFIHQINQIQS
ncbi:hypothetical protein BGZ93_000964 [Podila epicladia]|nr:hypothetical protein BGZ92_005083 [Podila epicladia]KAG0084883.1 hypothetical protein BGZ93_000964 [Podila epicladia]